MGIAGGPDMIQDGLVLSLDAADRNSYVSGSTTWFDLSGNNYSGSLISGSGFTTSNMGAITFNGVNSYVDLESARTQILTYTSSVTFDLFFKMDSWVNSFYNGILTLGRNPDPGSGTQAYMLSYINSSGFFNVQFGNSTGTTGNSFFSSAPIQSGSFYNFTFSYNNGTASLYQNGNLITSSINSTSTIYNTNQNKFFLGGDSRYNPGTAGRYFSGSVYDLKIYNRALSASEVLQNYNAQKSRFNL